MISDVGVIDNLYNFIKGTALEQAISGELCKTIRPKDSEKEDIVISVISNMSAQIQEVYANVNIYVKDLTITTKDGHSQNEMDIPRCRVLCDLAFDLLETGIGDSFRFEIESQRVLPIDELETHVINNRILYKQVNEK